jgi:hypothetical protein
MQDAVGENRRATPRKQDEAAKAGAQRTEGAATAPAESGAAKRPDGGEPAEGPHVAGESTGGSGGRGSADSTERTHAGQQHVLPGAERAPDPELAQRRADERLKPKVAQRPADFGLFSDESKQTDLVDMARKAPLDQEAARKEVLALADAKEPQPISAKTVKDMTDEQ